MFTGNAIEVVMKGIYAKEVLRKCDEIGDSLYILHDMAVSKSRAAKHQMMPNGGTLVASMMTAIDQTIENLHVIPYVTPAFVLAKLGSEFVLDSQKYDIRVNLSRDQVMSVLYSFTMLDLAAEDIKKFKSVIHGGDQ